MWDATQRLLIDLRDTAPAPLRIIVAGPRRHATAASALASTYPPVVPNALARRRKLCAVRRMLRYLWALPTTLIGLLFLPLALISGGGYQVIDGVIEIHGGLVELFLRRCTLLKGGASAMTLGHVVIGRDLLLLELTRPHERVHVRQCERWGIFFLPAYGIASIIAFLRGGSMYRDNAFEREAYDAAP